MGAYDDYLSAVVDHFWDYAEHEFGDRPQLFERSDRSPNRPPVFVGGAAEHNVLYPPHAEPNVRQTIVTSVPTSERHRHFASMRSSQALAQSVFGSLAALGKAGVLAGLTTDDELPTVRSGVTVQMEKERNLKKLFTNAHKDLNGRKLYGLCLRPNEKQILVSNIPALFQKATV